MSRYTLTAILFSIAAIFASGWIATHALERIPHLEDEIAYVWQARLLTEGELSIPSPVEPKKFLVPFVVDYEGQRFGKYPLGWPLVLSLGIRLGARWLVNPLLAGVGVWLTFLLGKKLLNEKIALLAAGLTLTSPFFLINGAALLSHPLGLVLAMTFVLGWWHSLEEQPGSWRWALLAGLALGALAFTRPFTAVGVALPFGIQGLWLLLRSSPAIRKNIFTIGFLAAALGSLHFWWQYQVTGDPFLNPYELWWPYDKIGFGPGYGVMPQGHNIWFARWNTEFTLWVGATDLFGWPKLSWLFLPFGIWALRKDSRALITGSVFFSLVVIYLAYWIGAWVFGPRYYFESLFSVTLLSAAGIGWLLGWAPLSEESPVPEIKWPRARHFGVTLIVGFLVTINLFYYLPLRIDYLHGLYGISREALLPFETSEHLAPAVIIVKVDNWFEHGGLLDLQTPDLTSPFIFAYGDKPGFTDTLRQEFPERTIYYYYPADPWVFHPVNTE